MKRRPSRLHLTLVTTTIAVTHAQMVGEVLKVLPAPKKADAPPKKARKRRG